MKSLTQMLEHNDKYTCHGIVQYLCASILKNRGLHTEVLAYLIDVFLMLLSRGWDKQAFDILETLLICYDDPLVNFTEKIFTAILYVVSKKKILRVGLGRGILYLLCALIGKYGFESIRSLIDRLKKGGVLYLINKTIRYYRYLASGNKRNVVISGLCKIITDIKDIDKELLKSIVRNLCDFIKTGVVVDVEMEKLIERLSDFPVLYVNEFGVKHWMPEATFEEKKYLMLSLEEHVSKRRMTLFMLKGLFDKTTMNTILEFAEECKLETI